MCKPCYDAARYRQLRLLKTVYDRGYRAANKTRLAKQHADWHIAHSDERRAYRLANADKIREQSRLRGRNWREKNRDKERARLAAYDKTPAGRASRWARKTRRRAAGYVAPDVLRMVLDRYGDGCVYCRYGKYEEIDHIVPVAMGGTNDPDNLVPSCSNCNNSKGSKSVSGWLHGA